MDAATVETRGDPLPQQSRTPAPAHPFGMWFCPMPRCARREEASPTGWGCLQSLVNHLRSVHLSTGSAPPESWLRAHNLRVCLACHELSAVGSRCLGRRCCSTMLAALAAGISAPPPARTRSPLSGPPPRAWISSKCWHADPHVAPSTHCDLLQLRPGPDVPAAGCGSRADVESPGPAPPLPPHRAGSPGPRGEGHPVPRRPDPGWRPRSRRAAPT